MNSRLKVAETVARLQMAGAIAFEKAEDLDLESANSRISNSNFLLCYFHSIYQSM